MIYFDGECLRKQYRGFYTFTDNLARCLFSEAKNRDEKIGFYLPQNMFGRYGDDASYMKFSKYHKLFFHLDRNVDVYHVSRQKSKYIPNISGAKILMTVHDLNFLTEKDPRKHRRYIYQYQRSIDKADRIVAISEYTKKDILKYLDVKGKTVDVVYNGLPVPCGSCEPSYKPSGSFLFTVGYVTPKKNFHVLPCLLKGNEYDLVIAGRIASEKYAEKIMEEARKWGVEDRVHILGTISEGEKYWYYENCLAFCFPSIAEGFALPLLEAMQCGKPVFASDHTCIPEIAGDCAFYFDHNFDREKMMAEFRDGIERFKRGEITPSQLMAHAEKFSWENAAKQYFNIYEEMISQRQATHMQSLNSSALKTLVMGFARKLRPIVSFFV